MHGSKRRLAAKSRRPTRPFQPRRAKNRWGRYFISFLPAISAKAAKAIRQTIRAWRMASTRNNQRLEDLARLTNPAVRGWMNYYGRFYRSKCVLVLRHLNVALAQWARRKFKRFKRRERASVHWLGCIAQRDPNLFCVSACKIDPLRGVIGVQNWPPDFRFGRLPALARSGRWGMLIVETIGRIRRE